VSSGRRVKAALRTARTRWWRAQRRTRQVGQRLTPPAWTPTEVTQSFDYWAYRSDLHSTVAAALADAGIDHLLLSERMLARPVVVIRRADAGRARAALTRDPRTKGCFAAQAVNAAVGPATPIRWRQPLLPQATGLVITRNLVTPEGLPLVHPDWGVVLDLWDERDAATFMPVGGNPPPDALVARTPNGVLGHIAGTVWQEAQLNGHRLAARPPHLLEVHEPVDLVYTWVDGADPAWQARRAQYLGKGLSAASHAADSAIGARFENRDELRYSLRSVEMFANWVRHIWIVTDQQVPHWLRTDHPRLTVVDHREIFADPSVLPSFNSHAIESQLHHIPGLANLYLYLNDDVLFGSPVRPENFYHGNGLVKFFPSPAEVEPRAASRHDVAVTAAAKNNREFLERTQGRTLTNKMRHAPIPQSVTVLRALEAEHPELFEQVTSARFRRRSDYAIVSSLVHYYGFLKGKAVPGRIRNGYLDVASPNAANVLELWLRSRSYHSLCLNDSGTDDPAVDLMLREFLEQYFPLSSAWER